MAEAIIFETIENRPPPRRVGGPLQWIQERFFGSVTNTLITLVCIYMLYVLIPPIINWVIIDANISGTDRSVCDANPGGACWTFIKVRFDQLIFGLFFSANPDQLWRPITVFAVLGGMIAWLVMPVTPNKREVGIFALFGFPVFAYTLIEGSLFGLPAAHTNEWGGFMLNISLAYIGIAASLPIGIVLALGRRSELPVIRTLSVSYIEFWRGAPLITVLFMSSVMLPLFFPSGVEFNKVVRAMIAITLFEAAYAAEVVRGGLQAIPKGQFEAADALGLSYWKKMSLIVLPQSLKISIPGIVNTFISLFKDTSLVAIIGLLDILNSAQNASRAFEWKGYDIEALIFAAFIFWICTYSMSRYSHSVERRLDRSKRS
ncbi:MAG TPA: amino acid ABC transporter permease [Hyphomicrobiales bacterium]|nr:amino acid ABC transporter permease [Hyphomicrobiales bacterium]